ncbi:hypothetical protein CTA2_8263 [Colletotrichum tanaceti]|nr:hypothetical protein CTA2_8263 [Colletotrichum tanaceti]
MLRDSRCNVRTGLPTNLHRRMTRPPLTIGFPRIRHPCRPPLSIIPPNTADATTRSDPAHTTFPMTRVPPNVKFEIDDVESAWVHDKKYDFVFSRYMCGSIADWPTYMKRVYANLNPGGWAEFQDWSFMIHSDDGSAEGTEFLHWVTLFMEACDVFGRDGQVGPKLEGLVRENTGLINVRHQPYRIPVGPWAKDPYLKDIGMCNLIQLLDGLEGFSMRLLCGALGWTREAVIVLLAGVRRDVREGRVHAWMHYNVVYGQRPEEEADQQEVQQGQEATDA